MKPSVDTVPRERIPTRAWLTLLAIAIGAFVVQVDSLVVAVAGPGIAAGLRVGPADIQWVSSAQTLALASLAIPSGTVADRFGRKRMFLIGVGGFAAASLVCGFAPSIGVLIAGRVLQGMCAALLLPSGLGAIRAAFPASQLPMALGVFTSMTAVAMSCAPILGGLLVESGGWSWAFFASVPFGVVGVIVGALCIGETERKRTSSLDMPGAALATLAMVSVVWALTGAQQQGWGSARTLGFLALGAVLLAGFVGRQRLARNPLVPLELFGIRSFVVGLVLLVLTTAALGSVTFYLMFYLQGVRGMGSLASAVILLPLTVVLTVAPPIGGLIVQRIGARATILVAALCNAVAFGLMMRLTPDSSTWEIVPSLLLIGIGIGFLMVSAVGSVLGSVPTELTSVAAGVKQSMQYIGATLGVAGFGTLLITLIGARLPSALQAALVAEGALGAQLASDPQLVRAAGLGYPPALQAATQAGWSAKGVAAEEVQRVGAIVTETAHQVFTDGVHVVFGVGVVLAVMAGLLAMLLPKTPVVQADSR
ncbi:MFS transporter [Nocardia panacis]|uniref:MFS transporter n=1 Tax=Nocardia panacis TaxID=2340916 RepID=UPI001315A27C|nr:MFS transporter [Nocardia panacis]